MKTKINKSNYGYLFISPFYWIHYFGLVPILYTLYLSFTKWDGFDDPVFLGIANYERILQDSFFIRRSETR